MKTKIIYNKSSISMPEVDDNSIDCIMTSPPYWGLRDYGKEVNQIWDGNKDCQHQWEIVKTSRPNASGGHNSSKLAIKGQENFQESVDYSDRTTKSSFCQLCHAWHGQLGLEPTLKMYIDHLLLITAECKRVLKPTGVMWWNHGDCYSAKRWSDSPSTTGISRKCSDIVVEKIHGLPDKCLVLQNYRLILKMVDEQGWILRNTVIWSKPNGMPSSVKDRLANKYEPVFMLVKNKKYWFDLDAIREKYQDRDDIARRVNKQHLYKDHKWKGESQARSYQENKNKGQDYVPLSGKNPGDVWTIPTQPYPEAHFATFPEKLLIKPILSSCPEGGIVLDPFAGSGTTLAIAHKYHRQYIGYELNPKYLKFIYKKIAKEDTLFNKEVNIND